MKKNILLLIFGLMTLVYSKSSAAEIQFHRDLQLSDEAKMSLLTASPGEALYSVFGHSALWVYDPLNNIDEVYNWGTFDFDTPNFYILFLWGRLYYMLTVTTLQQFLYSYMIDGRSVHEQELNLLPLEIQRIYDFLQVNRLPENTHYLYDFFYDNCATRIRDLIDAELDIDWGPDPHPHEERSFRQMIKPYVQHIPWIRFGIDIILGLPSDRIATPWHYMFLPDEMEIAFQHARHSDGRMLVTGYTELLPMKIEHGNPFPLTPAIVFWMLLAMAFLSLLKPRILQAFDKAFFSLLGITGLLIFFLWFVSDHVATSYNLNILWALPIHLYFVFRTNHSNIHNTRHLARIYFRIVFYAGLLLLILYPLNPQGMHPAFFPTIATMSVLAWKHAYDKKTGFKKR